MEYTWKVLAMFGGNGAAFPKWLFQTPLAWVIISILNMGDFQGFAVHSYTNFLA